MKRTALAIILILVLFSVVLLEAKSFQVAHAQFEGLPYDPPIVTILSPSPNGTYSVPDIPLNVTIQIRGFIYHNIETVKWLNYSLDGQTAIPMTLLIPSDLTPPYYVYGNDVLTSLSDGTHSLTIYGETAISGLTGNFNATVSFRIDTSSTRIAEPFPTTLVIVVIVAVAIFGIGSLFYFKKRQRGAH